MADGVGDNERQIVIQRMPTLAFLAKGERLGSIAFEHETFFSFFLAHRFAERLLGPGQPVAQLMARAVLPDELPAITIRVLTEQGVLPDRQRFFKTLSTLLPVGGAKVAQAQENAGRFAEAILKRHSASEVSEDLKLSNIVFPGGDLAGVTLRNCDLASVEFRRTDLSQTKFLTCTCSNFVLIEVLVDREATRLEVSGLDPNASVLGLRVRGKDELTTVYDPEEIKDVLISVGAVPAGRATEMEVASIPDHIRELVERLVRAYGRSNPVCADDPFLTAIFKDSQWRKVEKCLLSSGVVTEESRATSGSTPKRFFRRQVLPAVLMAGRSKDAEVPETVRRFWACLEASTKK